MRSLTSWLHRYISTMVFSLKLLAGLKMRRLVLLVSLLVTGVATAGTDMEYSGDAGWREVDQSAEAEGMLHFHYKSLDWAAKGYYHSYSSPFSLSLKINESSSQLWWERFCEQFSWMSDQPACPPELAVSGLIYFNDPFNPLEGGSIWRDGGDGDFIGWMYCAEDNSRCTLKFKGRKLGTTRSVWLEVKITFNEDRSVKFISGKIAEYFDPDEYYIVWHSRNLSQ